MDFGRHAPPRLDGGAGAGAGEGAGEAVWHLGGLLIRKAGEETTGGAFDLIEELLPAGAAPPWHVHSREDESFYVLDGQVTFYVGDQIIQAEPGAFVWLPRGIAHTFHVGATNPARMLEINTPAGLWRFFKEVGEPALARTLAPSAHVDLEKLRSIAPRYGIDILGPFNG